MNVSAARVAAPLRAWPAPLAKLALLKARGLRVCIPARSKRRRPASHNRRLYKKRCRTENAFARLKDWRGIAMRYTRCGDLFLSAIALAASVIFWLR